MYMCNFVIISHWRRAGAFIWTNLNPLHPKMLCAKFGWNGFQRFWRRRFFKFDNVFLQFRNYLPLEKDGAQLFWRRRWKCEKFTTTTTTTTTTDNGQILIRKAHLSLRLTWAKKLIICAFLSIYDFCTQTTWQIKKHSKNDVFDT